MAIQIKNKDVLIALLSKDYDQSLVEIIKDIVEITGDVVITEGWRAGSDVHSTDPCRGIDIRSWIYTTKELENIEETINQLWTYDSGRPDMKCLIIHDVGMGTHIHIQSHPQTYRKE